MAEVWRVIRSVLGIGIRVAATFRVATSPSCEQKGAMSSRHLGLPETVSFRGVLGRGTEGQSL